MSRPCTTPRHFMVDLETLGLRAGCPILEVAVVPFDQTGEEYKPLFFWMDPSRQIGRTKLRPDPATWQWWANKADADFSILYGPRINQPVLRLEDVAGAMRSFFGGFRPVLWSCGPSFDMSILAEAIYQSGQSVPWHFSDERCVRTACAGMPPVARLGEPHHALEDAKHQIRMVLAVESRWPGFLAAQV